MYGAFPFGAEPYGFAPEYDAPAERQFEHALFVSSREIDRAVLVGSTEVAGLPVRYLNDIQPAKAWRLTSKIDQHLAITLYRPVACDTVAIVGANFTSMALCRVIAASLESSLPGSPDLDTGWISVWPDSGKPTIKDWPVFTNLIRFENASAYSHWRLLLSDPGAETSYLQLARVMIDKAFQPQFNVDSASGLGLASPGVQTRTQYGRTYTDHRGPASRRLILPISAVNDREMKESLFELQRYCGLARDFVFSLEPSGTGDQHLYTMQALFADQAQFEAQPWWDGADQTWRTQLTLTEPI